MNCWQRCMSSESPATDETEKMTKTCVRMPCGRHYRSWKSFGLARCIKSIFLAESIFPPCRLMVYRLLKAGGTGLRFGRAKSPRH